METGRKIIIIGATSGIGMELARLYIEHGHIVGITGRREALLNDIKAIHPARVYTACFDVTQNNSVSNIQQLINEMNGLDLLIYNAGFGEVSEGLDYEAELKTTRTNVNGFVEIAAFAFNYFVKQGCGQIAVTSSIAALRGNRWSPSYGASKAFMSNYAEALNIKASRLKKDIVVTDIKPGFVNTKLVGGYARFWVASPHKAALQIASAIDKKKRVVYITRRWWLAAQILKHIPYTIFKRI